MARWRRTRSVNPKSCSPIKASCDLICPDILHGKPMTCKTWRPSLIILQYPLSRSPTPSQHLLWNAIDGIGWSCFPPVPVPPSLWKSLWAIHLRSQREPSSSGEWRGPGSMQRLKLKRQDELPPSHSEDSIAGQWTRVRVATSTMSYQRKGGEKETANCIRARSSTNGFLHVSCIKLNCPKVINANAEIAVDLAWGPVITLRWLSNQGVVTWDVTEPDISGALICEMTIIHDSWQSTVQVWMWCCPSWNPASIGKCRV